MDLLVTLSLDLGQEFLLGLLDLGLALIIGELLGGEALLLNILLRLGLVLRILSDGIMSLGVHSLDLQGKTRSAMKIRSD